MNKVVIGLCGPKGGGKTFVANALKRAAEERGLLCAILPFAGPVKSFALQMGWNGEKDEKGRRLLQLLGTECGRECIDEDIWAKAWRHKAASSPVDIVVADDLRFDNEARSVRSLNGGRIVHITGRTTYEGEHKSEVGIDSKYVTDTLVNTLDEKELDDWARAFIWEHA